MKAGATASQVSTNVYHTRTHTHTMIFCDKHTLSLVLLSATQRLAEAAALRNDSGDQKWSPSDTIELCKQVAAGVANGKYFYDVCDQSATNDLWSFWP